MRQTKKDAIYEYKLISLFSLRVAIERYYCYRQPWQLRKLMILYIHRNKSGVYIVSNPISYASQIRSCIRVWSKIQATNLWSNQIRFNCRHLVLLVRVT